MATLETLEGDWARLSLSPTNSPPPRSHPFRDIVRKVVRTVWENELKHPVYYHVNELIKLGYELREDDFQRILRRLIRRCIRRSLRQLIARIPVEPSIPWYTYVIKERLCRLRGLPRGSTDPLAQVLG